jgi:hypothetical protein
MKTRSRQGRFLTFSPAFAFAILAFEQTFIQEWAAISTPKARIDEALVPNYVLCS